MARGTAVADRTTLEMALVGYEIELEKIDGKIREIKSLLKGSRNSSPLASRMDGGRGLGKRNLSEAARARISAAQKKRWSEHRKMKALAAKSQ